MKDTNQNSTHRIRVAADVHDLDIDRHFIDIKFRCKNGSWRHAIFPCSIVDTPAKAREELRNRAAALPLDPGATTQLINKAFSKPPNLAYRLTGKTGWHGPSFVLPDVTLGPDADTLLHKARRSDAAAAPALTQGSLDRWLDQLREPCRSSSYLTFGIAVAFAAPLLRLVGQDEGAIFYLSGESSTGKTLTELAAQSVIQRASRDSLVTHDVTARSLEEHCAAHDDLMLVIDEIARMMGSQSERRKMLKEVTHKMVGGGGRQRSDKAKQDSTLADLRWRVMSLWSGENSLDPEFLGGVRERGELVRLIEIPVPKPGSSGIFDRLGDSQLSAIGLAKITEEAIKKNFGHPIRAFIEHLVSDPEKYGRRATQLLERFLEKVSAGNDPWTRRFATKFAVVYAAARLAAELEMAPWPKTHPLKCVKRLYNKARALVVTPEEALQDLLARLARNASSTRRFPVVAKGKALPAHLTKVAWGVRGKSYDGIPVVAVSTDRVDGLVRPAHYANRVRELLSERGYLVRGKEGRRVRQIQVQGFGSTEKPYFLCVRLDRLPQNKP